MPVDESGVWTPPPIRNRRLAVHMDRGKRGLVTDADAARLEQFFNSPEATIQEIGPIAMDIENHAIDAVGKANAAMDALKKTLDQFRSVIGNDLTSIKASSARVQTETQAMAKRYQDAAALLTTPEFSAAVNNAERLAAALEAIHRLQGQRIGFALFSGEAK